MADIQWPWSSTNPLSLFDFLYDFSKGPSEGCPIRQWTPLIFSLQIRLMIWFEPFHLHFQDPFLYVWSYCSGLVTDLAVPEGQHGTCRNHLLTHTQVGIVRSLSITETLITGLVTILNAPRKGWEKPKPSTPAMKSTNFTSELAP